MNIWRFNTFSPKEPRGQSAMKTAFHFPTLVHGLRLGNEATVFRRHEWLGLCGGECCAETTLPMTIRANIQLVICRNVGRVQFISERSHNHMFTVQPRTYWLWKWEGGEVLHQAWGRLFMHTQLWSDNFNSRYSSGLSFTALGARKMQEKWVGEGTEGTYFIAAARRLLLQEPVCANCSTSWLSGL
jgi:hypothetical protein